MQRRRGDATKSQVSTYRRQPIVTLAETAECLCPDFCERDHEQD
jgi:hypothetical protein